MFFFFLLLLLFCFFVFLFFLLFFFLFFFFRNDRIFLRFFITVNIKGLQMLYVKKEYIKSQTV